MTLCKLCKEYKYESYLRQADQPVAEFIRTSFNKASFGNGEC